MAWCRTHIGACRGSQHPERRHGGRYSQWSPELERGPPGQGCRGDGGMRRMHGDHPRPRVSRVQQKHPLPWHWPGFASRQVRSLVNDTTPGGSCGCCNAGRLVSQCTASARARPQPPLTEQSGDTWGARGTASQANSGKQDQCGRGPVSDNPKAWVLSEIKSLLGF